MRPGTDPLPDEVFDAARRAFVEGTAHLDAGRFDAAIERLEASLALLPGRPSTLVNLGIARLAHGDPRSALQALDAALAAEPGDAPAHLQRARALGALGRDGDALAACARAMQLAAPGDPLRRAARAEQALVLNRMGRHGDALAALQAAAALGEIDGAGWTLRGRTLQCLARHGEALAAYETAVRVDPSQHEAWLHRGLLLKDLGRDSDAAESLRRAAPGVGDLAAYALAAIGHGAAPGASPPRYVRALFDGYHADFDRHLVDELQYRGHLAVVDELDAALGDRPRPAASALDLGCGSGLCGPGLARLAREVVGVDLSPIMLAQAGQRGAYAVLVADDLVHHLQTTERRHDLVAAADVFIYLGDLRPVFDALRRVLRPGGLCAFTIELARPGETYGRSHVLRRSLRYAHDEAALQAMASGCGPG